MSVARLDPAALFAARLPVRLNAVGAWSDRGFWFVTGDADQTVEPSGATRWRF